MNIPKAMFFDVDGTLLEQDFMPESTKKALRYARDKGVLLFLATGRHKQEIKEVEELAEFKFDGVVSLNGGYCYVDDNTIYKKAMNKKAVRMVVDYIVKNPSTCMFCEEHEKYAGTGSPVYADIFQMVTFGDNALDYDFLMQLPGIALTSWTEGCYDVVPTGTNKWAGILHMAKHFGLNPNEIATIGDSQNDIAMLANAKYSIAMGNASDEIKKHAKYVTANIKDNGILQAVNFLFNKRSNCVTLGRVLEQNKIKDFSKI